MITKLNLFLERHYWGNQGAGVLPYCEATGRYLVGFRSADVKEPHTWGLFGGAINFDGDDDDVYDDTIDEGAIREFREETGYDGDVELIKGFVFKDTGFTYTNFIGLVPEEFEPVLNWENEDTKWLTYDELLQLDNKHFGLQTFMDKSLELFTQKSGV